MNGIIELSFGEKLKDIRSDPRSKHGKQTLKEVSKGCGVDDSFIQRLEDGRNATFLEKIKKLALYYDVSADYLLGIHDFMSPMSDLQGVHNFTGLSEKSIFTLMYFKDKVPEIIDVFNSIVENDEFGATLLLLQKINERSDLLKQRIEKGIFTFTREELTDLNENIELQKFRASRIVEKLVYSALGIDELSEALSNSIKETITDDNKKEQ